MLFGYANPISTGDLYDPDFRTWNPRMYDETISNFWVFNTFPETPTPPMLVG